MNRNLNHAAACSLVLAAMIWTGFDGSCGRVRGMISIGDINARVAERQQRTISYLEQFMCVL